MKHHLFWIVVTSAVVTVGTATRGARAELVFYMADGNNSNSTENHIVKYSSTSGFSSAQLHDSTNKEYNWPSDFQKVGSSIYGIDTSESQLMLFSDIDNGLWNPVGSSNKTNDPGALLSGLAYNAADDQLYVSIFNNGPHTRTDSIKRINRTTGLISSLLTNPLLLNIRGIAFNPANSRLYAYSADTGNMLSMDPEASGPGGTVQVEYNLDDGSGAFYDELTFFEGQLYGSWASKLGAQETAQLRRIDVATGASTDIGPLVNDISAHALYIASVPEPSMVPLFLAMTGMAIGGRYVRNRFRKAS